MTIPRSCSLAALLLAATAGLSACHRHEPIKTGDADASTAEKLGAVAGSAQSTVEHGVDATKTAAQQAADKAAAAASKAADAAVDKSKQAAAEVKDVSKQAVDDAKAAAQKAKDDAKKGYDSATQ